LAKAHVRKFDGELAGLRWKTVSLWLCSDRP
jgi:hypothetical protein